MRHHESRLQQMCVRWFRLQYPELAPLLFAVPNGGKRNAREAECLRAEGVTAGVADLLLLKPYCGGGRADPCRVGKQADARSLSVPQQVGSKTPSGAWGRNGPPHKEETPKDKGGFIAFREEACKARFRKAPFVSCPDTRGSYSAPAPPEGSSTHLLGNAPTATPARGDTDKHYYALCIEMKWGKGRQSEHQRAWQEAVTAQGYRYEIVRSFEDFQALIQEYIGKSSSHT